MTIVVSLLAIFGLQFFIRESDGPWGLMAQLRNILMRNKYVGVFFFKLLECPFCAGCHCGWLVYLLATDHVQWQQFIIWTLAGGAFSLLIDAVLSRLHKE